MQIDHAVLTHRGLRRKRNDDAYLIENRSVRSMFHGKKNFFLIGIADGMGGHACGDIASRMACEELSSFLDELISVRPWDFQDLLKECFFHIDNFLRVYASTNIDCSDMGTTLSALTLFRKKGFFAHAGDCRIHRLRGPKLKTLTTDHSLVQEMVEEGLISPEEAKNHPFRNKLTQAIGTSEPLERVDTGSFSLRRGDRYMLSTDGLHGDIGGMEIMRILKTAATPQAAVDELIFLALQRGGRDNITAIVIFLD